MSDLSCRMSLVLVAALIAIGCAKTETKTADASRGSTAAPDTAQPAAPALNAEAQETIRPNTAVERKSFDAAPEPRTESEAAAPQSKSLPTPQQGDQAQPIGWASADGGVQGGQGGKVVTVQDASSFIKAIESEEPLTIHVSGTINLSDSVRIEPKKSIIGLGADAGFTGGGLRAFKSGQIIIQNVAISNAKDAIDIEASHHIWIDHCDLSNCTDGLLDVKRGSDFITISWNHFHDHHKTTLVGHSDKDEIRKADTGHLLVTYHHNFFDGTETRHPRVRYGEPVHVFNNYFLKNEHGVHSSMDAGVLVEGNYFEQVRHPTNTEFGDSPEPGRLTQRNNVFMNCEEQPQVRGTVREVPYPYNLDPAAEVPKIVQQGAGVGKISGNLRPDQ